MTNNFIYMSVYYVVYSPKNVGMANKGFDGTILVTILTGVCDFAPHIFSGSAIAVQQYGPHLFCIEQVGHFQDFCV